VRHKRIHYEGEKVPQLTIKNEENEKLLKPQVNLGVKID